MTCGHLPAGPVIVVRHQQHVVDVPATSTCQHLTPILATLGNSNNDNYDDDKDNSNNDSFRRFISNGTQSTAGHEAT